MFAPRRPRMLTNIGMLLRIQKQAKTAEHKALGNEAIKQLSLFKAYIKQLQTAKLPPLQASIIHLTIKGVY